MQVERERECVQALNHDERVYMATLVLEGWRFRMRDFYAGSHKWVATPPGSDRPVFYAPTLFSLLGYIERGVIVSEPHEAPK